MIAILDVVMFTETYDAFSTNQRLVWFSLPIMHYNILSKDGDVHISHAALLSPCKKMAKYPLPRIHCNISELIF
jgi:hypothetical protein